MNKKVLKAIKNISIVLICAALIISFIVSQHTHHLEICHEEHCAICTIICIAQNLINLFTAIILCVYLGFLIYYILAKSISINQTIFTQKSLVFQKVQFNE